MTGITRQKAAEAVASLFGTTAVHSRSSRTYDPWEVTDNEGKTWRFVYDSSIHGSHRIGRQQLAIGDSAYKVEMNSPKLEYREMPKLQEVVRALRHAGAVVNGSCGMHQVKDSLDKSALALSGGQQQRLCIARAIAMKPDILLLDEPASALDPISTGTVEETLVNLKEDYTIIIVTHNMQQAARISDYTAFFYLGKVMEYDKTNKIFTRPKIQATEDYVSGHFG